MSTSLPRARPRARRAGAKVFPFTYRCPAHLIGPLNEAKFVLREESRTALLTKAIVEYLRARAIEIPAA